MVPTVVHHLVGLGTILVIADEETGVYVTFRMSGLRKIEPDELRSSLTFLGQEGDDLPVEAHVILPPGTFLDHGIELISPRKSDSNMRKRFVLYTFVSF